MIYFIIKEIKRNREINIIAMYASYSQALAYRNTFHWGGIYKDGASGGVGDCSPPKLLLASHRHLNFHASLALHKIRDLFLVFLGNTIGIVYKDSRTPLTISTLTALAPLPSNFSGAITGEI